MNAHNIELKLHSIQQLYNSMDPSPFHERDLDRDAETFIESWAQECPRHTAIRIVIHLEKAPMESDAVIVESIHNYFNYKADLNRNDLRRMLREGWSSLLIGVSFLIACTMAAHSVTSPVVSEGFTIIGWVAMWRPLEIYLYRWWPVRQLGTVYRKLGAADVEVRLSSAR